MLATFYKTEELEIPIFLKVIRCILPHLELWKKSLPAGLRLFSAEQGSTRPGLIFMTVYKVTLPTYIWITTNHCKDPYQPPEE